MPAGSSAADQKADRRDEIMKRRRELQGEQLTMAAATAWRRRRWRPTARGWGWRRPNSGSSRWNAP
jgi:hypothetical protein